MNPFRLRRIGLVGTALTALCCLTPFLGFLLGAAFLGTWGGTLDLILFPLLAVFLGLTAYAHTRCCRR